MSYQEEPSSLSSSHPVLIAKESFKTILIFKMSAAVQRSPKHTRTLKNNMRMRVLSGVRGLYFMWPTHPAAPDSV